jgi:hypothetical protein
MGDSESSCWPFSTNAATQANVGFRGNAEVSRSPGNHNRKSAGNLSATAEALCKSRMPRWHGGAVGARTATQAGYLATVQDALSGNRWGFSTKRIQASETCAGCGYPRCYRTIWLKSQVRRAGTDEQRAVYERLRL